MSDIGLHWNAIGLFAIAPVVCSPGLAAGLLLAAIAWRERRVGGAALNAALLTCRASRWPTDWPAPAGWRCR